MASLFSQMRKKSQLKAQKWSRLLGHCHLPLRLGCKPLNGNSVPIVKAQARLPCCFQEALCVASAKAIFSYGVTERQRAARSI